jgi:hypothetical protein
MDPSEHSPNPEKGFLFPMIGRETSVYYYINKLGYIFVEKDGETLSPHRFPPHRPLLMTLPTASTFSR